MTTLEKFIQIKNIYLSSLKVITKSNATFVKYQSVLDDFEKCLSNYFADEQATEITSQMIFKYSEAAKQRGIKNNTLRHYLTIIKTFLSWSNEHKFYIKQPIIKNDIPKKERIEYDLLTQDEITLILSGKIPPYTKHANRNRAIIILLLSTGLRVSELINLHYEDIDFDNYTLTIIGKGNKKRTTALPSIAIKSLESYINQGFSTTNKGELLFKNKDNKSFSEQNISQIVERYVEKLTGHKNIRSHDLRHAYASLLITNNIPIPHISQALGHSNWETTAIYASHLCPQKQVNEVNDMFNRLFPA